MNKFEFLTPWRLGSPRAYLGKFKLATGSDTATVPRGPTAVTLVAKIALAHPVCTYFAYHISGGGQDVSKTIFREAGPHGLRFSREY
jgi:hypothetical protein